MLESNKKLLEHKIKLRKLAIMEKELRRIIDFLNQMINTASVIAAFSAMTMVGITLPDEKILRPLKLSYFIFQGTSLIFELVALVNSNLCVVFAEGLALYGEYDSIVSVLAGLRGETRIVLWYFKAGIVSFMIAATLWMWINFSQEVAIGNSILMGFFTILFYWHNYSIKSRFKAEKYFFAIDAGADTKMWKIGTTVWQNSNDQHDDNTSPLLTNKQF